MVKLQNNRFFVYPDEDKHVQNNSSVNSNLSTVNICVISDNNYFKYLLITVNSIIMSKNPDTRIEFFLILDNVTRGNRIKLGKFKSVPNVKINIIEYSSKYIKLNTEESRYITSSTYIRLDIPKLIPEKIGRLLYLDCDIIVRHDLSDLYRIDLEDNIFAAVRDFSIACLHKNNPNFSYLVKDIDDIDYFNAGVILMDLDKLRRDGFSDNARLCYKQHPEFKFADQDILNFLYRKRTKYLSCKYNFQILYALQNCVWSSPANDLNAYKRLFGVEYGIIEDMIFDVSIIHLLGNKEDLYNKYVSIRNMIDTEIHRLENNGIYLK